MAWVFLVDGVSFEVSCKESDIDPYGFRKKFEEDNDFESIKESLDKNFVLTISPNIDDMKATVFIGVDLFNSQHIYQGKTVTCNRASDADRQVAETVADKLAEIVSRLAPNLPVTRRSGVILNQFD